MGPAPPVPSPPGGHVSRLTSALLGSARAFTDLGDGPGPRVGFPGANG
jgi:hypothetical protein